MDGGRALVQSHRETPRRLGDPRLPNSHCCWCNSVVAFDRPARGSRTNLARGIYGRVPPRRSNPGGDPIRLVGANSSRTSLVLGSDPQAKPSRSGQRSVRSRSSSDLHRAVGLRSRDDDRPSNTNCPGRLDTGHSRAWIKARAEERFLAAELEPNAYASYRLRVPMLLPFV